MIDFPDIVYRIRRQTTWVNPVRLVADETRSGASKVRMAHSAKPETYNVTLMMNAENANKFRDWFINEDLSGFYSFPLPKIDEVDGAETEYRFAADTQLSWTNVGGQIMEVTFDIEEVV